MQTAVLTPFRLTLPAISHLDMLELKSEKYENSLNVLASSEVRKKKVESSAKTE